MADDPHWKAIRKAVHEHLNARGNSHLAALGDEYVEAMKSGARLRALAEAEPFTTLKSGRVIASPLFEAADRDIRRGIQLAKALELNKARSKAGVDEDPFAELDADSRPVNLAERRRGRAKAKPA